MLRHHLEIPMVKANTAQITVQPTRKLAESFSESVELAFLRRDAWLNHILSAELPRIKAELAGHVNSAAARKFIEAQAAGRERAAMTISLDRSTADQIRALCDEHGVVRDALFNRLFLLLTLPPEEWASAVQIPLDAIKVIADTFFVSDSEPQPMAYEPRLHYIDVFTQSPLAVPADFIRDPFSYHREVIDLLKSGTNNALDDEERSRWQSTSFWRLSFAASFPAENPSHLAAYDLIVSDIDVPGTAAWEELMAQGKQLLGKLKGL